MKRLFFIINIFCISIVLGYDKHPLSDFEKVAIMPAYVSPIEMKASPDGAYIYVADETSGNIVKFDVKKSMPVDKWKIANRVNGLALSADGSKIYAVSDRFYGKLSIVNADSGIVENIVKLQHTPMSPVLNPKKLELYVANRFSNTVSVINLQENKVIQQIKVPREPVAMTITPDGKQLFVVNLLPRGSASADYLVENARIEVEKISKAITFLNEALSTEEVEDLPKFLQDMDKNEAMLVTFEQRKQELKEAINKKLDFSIACEVSVVDLTKQEQGKYKSVKNIKLPNGAINARGVCISPDGEYIYLTHQIARYQAPTSQVTRGWINTNAITVINTMDHSQHTVLLDDLTVGAANPWGVTCSEDGTILFVTHSALLNFSCIDRKALHEKIANYPKNKDIFIDLTFMTGIRKRQKIPCAFPDANGARSIIAIGDKAFLGLYFEESLAEFNWKNIGEKMKVYALSPRLEINSIRRGEIYFHDAEVCLQGWQSCISCHPDARADSLNWDLLNDGIGNPKQGKSMLFSHVTTPCMISGIRPNAEIAVVAGVKYIQFGERPKSQCNDIDNYLKHLRPEISPYLVDGKLSKAAKKGQKHFKTYGCISCHPAPYYTDRKMHQVGTGISNEKGRAWDTPTLIEIWRTAPYLYDGRVDNIVDLIKNHNSSGMRGQTTTMTDKEIEELAEFVLSL